MWGYPQQPSSHPGPKWQPEQPSPPGMSAADQPWVQGPGSNLAAAYQIPPTPCQTMAGQTWPFIYPPVIKNTSNERGANFLPLQHR